MKLKHVVFLRVEILLWLFSSLIELFKKQTGKREEEIILNKKKFLIHFVFFLIYKHFSSCCFRLYFTFHFDNKSISDNNVDINKKRKF